VPYTEPVRAAPRRIRIRRVRAAGVLLTVALIAIGLGFQPEPTPRRTTIGTPTRDHRGALGEAGGAVPAGTTVFDDDVPGVAKLDPALLRALRAAATDAANAGVELVVNGGWRSPAYEEQLRREAIAKYGSEAEAARWVATGSTSQHVSGDAVDLGPAAGTAWLSAHGAAHGLCQVYANEPWHYELRPAAVGRGCPGMYADPTHDPRMQP
jgi:D-alanyl-D-alanine carboxypeptidase